MGDEPTTAARQHRGGDDATRPPTPLNAIATHDAAPETRLVIGEERGYSQSGSGAMGTSDQSSRSKLLAWLAGFVVVFGAVSWLVTSRIAPAPPTHSHPATFTPGPTPEPVVCASTELALTGVLNECATEVPEEKRACSVAGDTLDAQVRLAGDNEAFLLYIELKGTYTGLDTYYLPGWGFGLGTNDVPKVGLLQSATGTLWESVAGVLTITGDGRSGTLSAIFQASSASLQASDGTTVVPGPTLSIDGPWSCP